MTARTDTDPREALLAALHRAYIDFLGTPTPHDGSAHAAYREAKDALRQHDAEAAGDFIYTDAES